MLVQLLMSLTFFANLSGAQKKQEVLLNVTMTSCGGQPNNVCVTAYTSAANETDEIRQGENRLVQFDWWYLLETKTSTHLVLTLDHFPNAPAYSQLIGINWLIH
uniref:PLAT domain-containing protein n=1 Tax=Trichuris muris TaxID=70415 RepID=A0A5S6QUE7_TRIMR